jgi:hypothetical protein
VAELKDLLLCIRKHGAQIFIRVELDGQWQRASLADLPDELWAKHVARFIIVHQLMRGSPHASSAAAFEEGTAPVRMKTEAEQDAASEGDVFETGA